MHSRGRRICSFVLPDSENPPSRTSEGSVHLAVTFDVPLQFPRPELAVRARVGCVFRTSMPKTSINKDSKVLSRKCDVDPDRKLASAYAVVLAKP
jgi:hypothetical protein